MHNKKPGLILYVGADYSGSVPLELIQKCLKKAPKREPVDIGLDVFCYDPETTYSTKASKGAYNV